MTRAGVIGCGNMGSAVARRLAGAGMLARVCDIDLGRAAAAAAYAAAGFADPGVLAAGCDVVLLSLPCDAEVDVVLPAVLSGLGPGGLVINLTTGAAAHAPVLAGMAAEAGAGYVTAPVSQAVDGARRGELTVFAAGTYSALTQAGPVLAAFSSTIIRMPGHQEAAAAKLLTNLAWAVNAAALGEILVTAVAAGVPAGMVREVLAVSCGDSWVARHDVPSVLLPEGDPARFDPSFTLRLVLKDLGLAGRLLAGHGVPPGMGSAARSLFARAAGVYGDDAPELSVVRLAEDAAGVSLAAGEPVPA